MNELKQISKLLFEGKEKKNIYLLLKDQSSDYKYLAKIISQFPSPKEYRAERKSIITYTLCSVILFSYNSFLLYQPGSPFAFLGTVGNIAVPFFAAVSVLFYYHRFLLFGLSPFIYLQVKLSIANAIFAIYFLIVAPPLSPFFLPLLLFSVFYSFFGVFLSKRLFYPYIFNRLVWINNEPFFKDRE